MVITFLARFLFISQTKKDWVNNLCTLSLPSGQTDNNFKAQFQKCLVKNYLELSIYRLDCNKLPLPNCEIDDNTKKLCQIKANKGTIKQEEITNCQLDNVCPDDLNTYKDLQSKCQ